MLKIGNIIYDLDIVNHKRVEFINYYENRLYNYIDNSLPTLIIGWENVKKNNLNVSILNKKINNNLYWEFSFEEIKKDHVDGVSEFIKLLPNYYFFYNYTYKNLDPIFENIVNINDIITKIDNPTKAYRCGNSVYILSNKNIYGIDLNLYTFLGFNEQELLEYLNYICIDFFYDEDKSFYTKYLKYFNGFEYTMRYLVTLI